VAADIKAYVTSPARWNGRDWLLFGGALAATGLAYHYDHDAWLKYSHPPPPGETSTNNYDLQDAAPALVLLFGTVAYANWVGDRSGRQESWAMLEASALGTATAFTLKYVAGREGPQETTNPDLWRHGGRSFPSEHTTFAFAVGTVMAESGSDEYRWLRRLFGYGTGVYTAYARVKHDQHWLSDTVAGAAIGAATAHFAMGRRYPKGEDALTAGLSILPANGGIMVTYRKQF
jgi:membrane-associated phospholipid phosphatase